MEGDGNLARQALAGRTAAYEQLVRRWSARVLALCHARVRNTVAAEDLAQETLLRGFSGLKTLHDPDQFGSWLLGIAARTCLDWLKSAKRTEVGYAVLGPDGENSVAARALSTVESKEEIDRLISGIESLPESHREVIMLYYYQKSTYRELADLLGVSVATINARLTQARAMLRERRGVTRT